MRCSFFFVASDAVGDVLDEAFEGADGDAELVEVFDDGREFEDEVADVEDGEGDEAGALGDEGGNRDADGEDEDAGEFAQDAVNAFLAGEFHGWVTPGGEAAEEEVDNHGDADEGEKIENFVFRRFGGLSEQLEELGGGEGHVKILLSFRWWTG